MMEFSGMYYQNSGMTIVVQCIKGDIFKVPYLRHDYGNKEWESVGRIITFGWQKEKYLPVKLAPVLLEKAVLGFWKVILWMSYSSMCQSLSVSYLKLVIQTMKVLIKKNCLKLWIVTTAGGFQQQITEQILRELAHQKLIQEPAFVIERWTLTLACVRSELKEIAAVYDNLQPTSRKIMRSITYPSNQNAQEKQFVK